MYRLSRSHALLWNVKMNLLILVLVSLYSLTAESAEKAMELCSMEKVELINSEVLGKSLVKANSWSTKIYGSSCVTCAQIYSINENTFMLHIISPTNEDMIINTSATMEFNLKNAKVKNRSIFHSCHVRYIKK